MPSPLSQQSSAWEGGSDVAVSPRASGSRSQSEGSRWLPENYYSLTSLENRYSSNDPVAFHFSALECQNGGKDLDDSVQLSMPLKEPRGEGCGYADSAPDAPSTASTLGIPNSILVKEAQGHGGETFGVAVNQTYDTVNTPALDSGCVGTSLQSINSIPLLRNEGTTIAYSGVSISSHGHGYGGRFCGF